MIYFDIIWITGFFLRFFLIKNGNFGLNEDLDQPSMVQRLPTSPKYGGLGCDVGNQHVS